MILLVLALLFGFACPLELTFELQEHDVMCFHEVLEVGARIILDYQASICCVVILFLSLNSCVWKLDRDLVYIVSIHVNNPGYVIN